MSPAMSQMQDSGDNSNSTPLKFFGANDTTLSLLLFLLVFAVFFPAINHGFLNYDDPEYVTANVHVQQGLTFESLKWAFAAHGANWHPLTSLSHVLDGQIFG